MITASILREARPTFETIAREPFLAALAENRLSNAALARWMREDTHFLRALRRMIGLLVADAPSEHAVDVMTSAYPALQAELDTFAVEAARIGEEIEGGPAPVTRRFNDMLFDAARTGFPDGIATYWAVEVAYLEAWSSVRERVGLREPYAKWIENWTSPAFREFVGALATIVDEHGDRDTARRRSLEVFELERQLWAWCHHGG